jgi:hypothetical protein
MTRILISAALETDWENGEEGHVAHAEDAIRFGIEINVPNSMIPRCGLGRFVGIWGQIVQFNLQVSEHGIVYRHFF